MNRSHWSPGDENVARLLGQAYDPPSVPAEFAQRVQARLLEVAAEAARQRQATPRRPRIRHRLAALTGVAALLGILALGLRFIPGPPAPTSPSHPPLFNRPTVAAPAPASKPAPILAPGQLLATRGGERCRVSLPDGSVLSLNQNTTVSCDSPRRITLKAGEIFVEVAPRPAEDAASLFTVAAPHRDIQAIGTRFLVRAEEQGTGVAVMQGRVHVNDGDQIVSAGQQLAPKASEITPAPRSSYLLDWTRDLVASAAPPLVPPSAHAGGALVAVDPQGIAAPLALRKYHIDVHIEDGFARTTIDQTYFNHTLRRLEGTFYFPVPTDASLSRLAMYVDGRLMEGGMVERDYGRMVFDQIVTKMKDPALLEWIDGRTFKMRVFPLEARQEKRIILSYTQRLPNLYGRLSYRFPAGHSLGSVRDWSFHALIKDGAKLDWHCDSHSLTPRREDGDLLLDASAHSTAMEGDLVLELRDQAGGENARFAAMEQDGFRYLMLRYRPDLPGSMKRPRRDWVFLFESSADRDPLLARTQAEVVRTILNNAEPDDTFALLTVDTQARHFTAAPQAATPDSIAAALAFLDHTHLLGALDLDAGLTAAAELLRKSKNPVLVHLGSGRSVLGERRTDILANRIPAQTCYVGVAVGKHGAADFMHRAAVRCQGHVTSINPDESAAWRTIDLLATLNAPRLLDVRITDPTGKVQFLCRSSSLPQGEELCAIARLPASAPLPDSVRITGTLDGRPFARELALTSPRLGAAYLPRTWARLEIDRLLTEDAAKSKDAIIALSKAMYVMTPYTSLLVLENEAMYAQYKVDRGRKDHWAMYPCPPRIPVVYEPPSPSEKQTAAPVDWSVQFDPITGQIIRAKDWAIQFDPITGEPINPLLDSVEGLNQENNQLGFYPPAMALQVKASGTIHNRGSNLIIPKGDLSAALRKFEDASAIGGSGGQYLLSQFSGRSAATRQRLLDEGGGNARSEAAVAAGLEWLALHQADEGHWSARELLNPPRTKPLPAGKVIASPRGNTHVNSNDTLATAAAVLPFLAAGVTPRTGKTASSRSYAGTVAAALDYLMQRQQRDGSWGTDLYADALAATALCEAYGLTSDPLLRPSAQLALKFLISAQNHDGGWGARIGRTSDLYPSGWVYLALKSGQMAGLSIPKKTWQAAERFLDACEPLGNGRYANHPGGRVTPALTAVAILCRQYSGVGPGNPSLVSGIGWLCETPPEKIRDLEHLFFATQVLHNTQGEPWTFWNNGPPGFRDILIDRQDRGTTTLRPHLAGSWAPDPSARLQGGRIVSTALALLCLEVYYRHLPLYRRNMTLLHGEPADVVAAPSFRLRPDAVFFAPLSDVEEAERRFRLALTDAVHARQPAVWRQAAMAAEQRNDYELARQRLEQALVLEAKQPHDLTSLRRDFAWQLRLAHLRVRELTLHRQPVPRDVIARVIALADRWRAVDSLDWVPCSLAALTLQQAGERELAWSYLTTPAALHGATAANWLEIARQQHWHDNHDLADRAFELAAALEPANAAIIWERALNQRESRRTESARILFRQLAEGSWDERYQAFQLRAREALKTNHE